MLSTVLRGHLQRVAQLYPQIRPGSNLSAVENRPQVEIEILQEISAARENIRARISTLDPIRQILVKTGAPKGAWAHIYYVSFHDTRNSNGPTEGFYPVFLMSIDQRQCWLTVMLAAASVGISGRGGWSNPRGEQLAQRAASLCRNIPEGGGWVKGPITLGANGESLHAERGATHSAGRAYECGAIISKCFNPQEPPEDIVQWLQTAFGYYDSIFNDAEIYVEAAVPPITQREIIEQANAAITGQEAEAYFATWAPIAHPEWGGLISRTNMVGVGYDFEFPDTGLHIEVKGCRGGLENIRITNREWDAAQEAGDNYYLAIVTCLDEPERTRVQLLRNPYQQLRDSATRQARIQYTYTVAHRNLRDRLE